jgi:DNA repair protein RadC
MGQTVEQIIVLPLDSGGAPLGISTIASGHSGGVTLRAEQIIKLVKDAGAKTFVMAHNHLTGWSYPSELDKQTTKIIAAKATETGLKLVAHLVIAQDHGRWYWSDVIAG